MRVLIAGCGYVGCELARQLLAAGHGVWGLRRNPADLPDGVGAIAADLSHPATLRNLPAVDAVAYTASADVRGGAAYRAAYVDGLRHLLAAMPAGNRRFVFTSSTGVYPQVDGETVDEDSPVGGDGPTTTALLDGETLVREAGGHVVRLAGIYGPGRLVPRFVEQVRAGQARYADTPTPMNLIHRDDCAGVLAWLLAADHPPPLILAADTAPTDRRAVFRWIADRLDLPLPPSAGPPQKGANKRCNSARLQAAGYRFCYPTFREGFAAVLDSDR